MFFQFFELMGKVIFGIEINLLQLYGEIIFISSQLYYIEFFFFGLVKMWVLYGQRNIWVCYFFIYEIYLVNIELDYLIFNFLFVFFVLDK